VALTATMVEELRALILGRNVCRFRAQICPVLPLVELCMRRSWTPSIVPNGHDQTVYLVLNDFGTLGRAYDFSNSRRRFRTTKMANETAMASANKYNMTKSCSEK
jgi:hypothetical protein